MSQLYLFIFFSFLNFNFSAADEKNECYCEVPKEFPIPKLTENDLFYIQRTPNTNTIVYALNFNEKNQLVEDEPVKVYWLRYAETGQKEELSYIQKHFAYGIENQKLTKNQYELNFVSYKNLKMQLEYSKKESAYQIISIVNDKKMVVKQIFLEIDGGTFWLPKLVCVKVSGIDWKTGKEMTQYFKP